MSTDILTAHRMTILQKKRKNGVFPKGVFDMTKSRVLIDLNFDYEITMNEKFLCKNLEKIDKPSKCHHWKKHVVGYVWY